MTDRTCEACGDIYTPKTANQRVCGKEECRKARKKWGVKKYSYKKNEGLETPKPKKKPTLSPASKRWASMSWTDLTKELLYYKMSYPESQKRAEKNTLPEEFGKKRKKNEVSQ